MKRFFSFMMVVTLIFSMSMTAFAAPNDGTITITNATKGHTYKLYKIFDATFAVDEDGNPILNADGKKTIAYSIDTDNQFFTYLFGNGDNPYFSYNASTGAVGRKADTMESDITDYLEAMVQNGSYTAVDTKTASSDRVVFDELSYGYYLIDKGVGTSVTINSTAPSAEVIDKNQIPGTGFGKWVFDEDTNEWVKETSANIGDIVDFKVEFTATNYDGEHKIKYYTVDDTKGDSLWVEFNSITVKVTGGTDDPETEDIDESNLTLSKGYYHCATPGLDTYEWKLIGTGWNDADRAAENATPGSKKDEANWYLIHYGYDKFDIVIPWQTEQIFTGTTNGFTLEYGQNATHRYDSPVNVLIEYEASVEPGANIGNTNENLKNKATLTWTSNVTDGPDDPSITNIIVYALGLNKVDAATEEYLAGAVFEIFRDPECETDPVYVIPTDVKGVYILDDLYTVVSGENRETSRDKYAAYLEAYLDGKTQKNEVTTEANGKILILGLEAGKYYLLEKKAPDGYNKVSTAKEVEVGTANNNFFVIADENGNVVNEQAAIEGYTKLDYTATVTTVENSKGVELPSTGGAGTARMIMIGSMIAFAFAVLLITHKKMSVYHD